MRATALIAFAVLPADTTAQVADHCVAVSTEFIPKGSPIEDHPFFEQARTGVDMTRLKFTNNCSYGVYLSWCWDAAEGADNEILCTDAEWEGFLSGRNMFTAGKTAETELVPRPGGRFWFSACRVGADTEDALFDASVFCSLRVERPGSFPSHAFTSAGSGPVVNNSTGRPVPQEGRLPP